MDLEYDLILRGGIVVSGEKSDKADIGIRRGRIKSIAPHLGETSAKEVMDVSEKLIFPGIIDVHVHPVYSDDMEACSQVAAYGGSTTLIHFAYAYKGMQLKPTILDYIERGEKSSRLDFALHCGLFDAPQQVNDISNVMDLGVRSFKFFIPYIKQGWSTDDYSLIKAMDILSAGGGLALVHAENGGGIDYLEDKYQFEYGDFTAFHRLTRPPVLEQEAIFRAICLAEITGCPLYIPHVTSARALRPIINARQEGKVVYAESCPHYLTLTEAALEEYGSLAKVGPPLRSEDDRLALWSALRDNHLQVVSSDHAAKTKDLSLEFSQQGFGSPQLETLLPLVYDQGVNAGKIDVCRLVQVLCENPARIFGLYPRKGCLQPGADADIVVFDPQKEFTICKENQHSNVGYTLYENMTLNGWPDMTFQRGKLVMSYGEIIANVGDGRFLPTFPPGVFI